MVMLVIMVILVIFEQSNDPCGIRESSPNIAYTLEVDESFDREFSPPPPPILLIEDLPRMSSISPLSERQPKSVKADHPHQLLPVWAFLLI